VGKDFGGISSGGILIGDGLATLGWLTQSNGFAGAQPLLRSNRIQSPSESTGDWLFFFSKKK
jgi:hypothetical protein